MLNVKVLCIVFRVILLVIYKLTSTKNASVTFDMSYCNDNYLLFFKEFTISSDDIQIVLRKVMGRCKQC